MKILFLVLAMAAMVYVAFVAVRGTTKTVPAAAPSSPAAIIQHARDLANQAQKSLDDEAKRADDAGK